MHYQSFAMVIFLHSPLKLIEWNIFDHNVLSYYTESEIEEKLIKFKVRVSEKIKLLTLKLLKPKYKSLQQYFILQ